MLKLENINNYSIYISGLTSDTCNYEFNLDNDFFIHFQHPDVEGGNVKAFVKLIKKSNIIELKIKLEGTLNVECDRCLEKFDYQINATDTITYVIGEQTDYKSDDIIVLSKDETVIDVSQQFYEIAVIQLPISKVHPEDSNHNSTCNQEMLKILDRYTVKDN